MGSTLKSLGVLTLGLLVLGGKSWADPPAAAREEKAAVKPSTPRTLRLPEMSFHYADIDLPAHFKTPAARRFDNTPRDNPVTDAGATLGRVLFYDVRLSASNNTACASCHHQKNAFVDPNRFSKGHQGKLTDRQPLRYAGHHLRYNQPRPILLGRTGVESGRSSPQAHPEQARNGERANESARLHPKGRTLSQALRKGVRQQAHGHQLLLAYSPRRNAVLAFDGLLPVEV